MELSRLRNTVIAGPGTTAVHDRHCTRGFTLLEVILAISIFAMVATVIFSSFNVGLSAWQRGERDIEFYQQMRSAVDVLQREISSTYRYQLRPGELDTHKLFLAFFGEADSLKFVSYANIHKRTGGLSLVELWVEEERGLLLGESAALAATASDLEAVDLRSQDNAVTVSPDVTRIEIRYFHRKKGDDEGEWLERWDPRDKGPTQLPLFVEITLTFVDTRDITFQQRLVIPLMTVAATGSV